MQYEKRERRMPEWDDSAQLFGAMFGFKISPQFGQQRTRTTMRP